MTWQNSLLKKVKKTSFRGNFRRERRSTTGWKVGSQGGGTEIRGQEDTGLPLLGRPPYPTTHLPCWSPLHPSPTSPEDVNKTPANLALPFLGLRLRGCLCDGNKEVHLPLDSSLGTPLRVEGACLSCSVFTTWASQGRGWCRIASTARGCMPGLGAHKKRDSTCSREQMGHVPHRLTDKWLEASKD